MTLLPGLAQVNSLVGWSQLVKEVFFFFCQIDPHWHVH